MPCQYLAAPSFDLLPAGLGLGVDDDAGAMDQICVVDRGQVGVAWHVAAGMHEAQAVTQGEIVDHFRRLLGECARRLPHAGVADDEQHARRVREGNLPGRLAVRVHHVEGGDRAAVSQLVVERNAVLLDELSV